MKSKTCFLNLSPGWRKTGGATARRTKPGGRRVCLRTRHPQVQPIYLPVTATDVCNHAVCTRPPPWTQHFTNTLGPGPPRPTQPTPAQPRPSQPSGLHPITLQLSAFAPSAIIALDSCWCQTCMCSCERVCLNVLLINSVPSDLVPSYRNTSCLTLKALWGNATLASSLPPFRSCWSAHTRLLLLCWPVPSECSKSDLANAETCIVLSFNSLKSIIEHKFSQSAPNINVKPSDVLRARH